MEDKNTEQREGENLNSNDQNNDQKTTFTADEVAEIKKQMQSDSEKWVQKVIWEKKAYQQAMQNLSDISDDNSKLLDLYEENPAAAKIILDTYFDGQDIETFKESIWYKVDYTDPKTIEKLVEEKAKALKESEKKEMETQLIEKEKNAFINKLKMWKEESEKFNEAFEERMELRSFKVSDLTKHLEKAYKEIANDEQILELKKQEIIANSLATGDWKIGKESKDRQKTQIERNSEYNKNFLKSRWIL